MRRSLSPDRLPRFGLILLVPVAAFVVIAGISLGANRGEKSQTVTSPPTVTLASSDRQPSPTIPATTETPLANRGNCSAISGTAYISVEEREWFLRNCGSSAASGVAAGSGTLPSATGPSAAGAGEYSLGDRLIIPAIGVDTTVNGVGVGANGQMATPVGYFYALWYDFRAFPGIGGYVDRGNLVLAGHVDCARCVNGGPGAAVFYNVRNLRPGDAIQYRTASGQVVNYVVTAAEWYLPNANWSSILASSAADLSIVTCIGTFDSSRREYSHRLVVYARKS